MKILTIALVLISVFLSLKHGWAAIRPASADQAKMMADLGVSIHLLPYIGGLSIAIGLMLLFPQTYFFSNLINAFIILLVMALSLKAGNLKIALIEIPFLALPLLLVWLKYPFKV
jgi:hypothetical protein